MSRFAVEGCNASGLDTGTFLQDVVLLGIHQPHLVDPMNGSHPSGIRPRGWSKIDNRYCESRRGHYSKSP